MPGPVENLELFGAGYGIEDATPLVKRRPWVVPPVHEKGGAIHRRGVIDRIVTEPIESRLLSAPEYKKLRTRKGRNPHRTEAVSDGVYP